MRTGGTTTWLVLLWTGLVGMIKGFNFGAPQVITIPHHCDYNQQHSSAGHQHHVRDSKMTVRMSAAQKHTDTAPGRTFLLGVGFTQFLLAQQLGRAGISSVAMTDVAKVDNIKMNWIKPSSKCTVVTNGEGEWEEQAQSCTALVICNEAADIPGRTIEALLRRMPNISRIVAMSPAGLTRGVANAKKVDKSWFSQMLDMGSQRVDLPRDNIEYAQSVEDAIHQAQTKGIIKDVVFIHRGKLNGGGGEYGLGEDFYKVCGSEPEEVLQRCYDNGRIGLTVSPGDSMDMSPKKEVPKSGGDDEEAVRLMVLEEIRDKTHRLPLVNSIVACLRMKTPPKRISVICSLGDTPSNHEEVSNYIDSQFTLV